MQVVKIFEWIQAWFDGVATQVMGMPVYWAAPMMIIVAVADSSLLSLPEINDIITVIRIANNPSEVYFFPIFPAVGSVIGCSILYGIARQGRNFFNNRFHPKTLARVEALYRRWGVLALAVPALLPPPLPFKVFVATAGAFGYPVKRFLTTVMIARLVRYYFWGIAAYFMRREVLDALEWLKSHFAEVFCYSIALILVIFIVRWFFLYLRSRSLKEKTASSFSD